MRPYEQIRRLRGSGYKQDEIFELTLSNVLAEVLATNFINVLIQYVLVKTNYLNDKFIKIQKKGTSNLFGSHIIDMGTYHSW